MVSQFLARQQTAELSYAPLGLSELSPAGFHIDEYEIELGRGQRVFADACEAVDQWAGFGFDWIAVRSDRPSPNLWANVAIVVRHAGFWSLNACRVVKRFPENPNDSRYGFAYGTLREHAETGEELFVICADDHERVTYMIRAVSKPRASLAKLGRPISRRIQARFRKASGEAMVHAVQSRTG